MRTIAVINAKRDCGKTTVATSLAAMLSFEGHLVALGDTNPLPLAGEWLSRRPSDFPKIFPAPLYGGLKAPPEADTLVIDTPPRLRGARLDNLLRRSHTALVPVLPSPVDLRATWRFVNQLAKLKPVINGQVKVGLVANRVTAHALVLRELAGFPDDFRVPVIGCLHDSINYQRAFAWGLSVTDLHYWMAAREWHEWEVLVQWIRSEDSIGTGA